MQAANNVVEVKPEEFENLKKPGAGKDLHDLLIQNGDSSCFETDEQLEFITTLDYDKDKPPSHKELELIEGILPQNDRETQGVVDKGARLFEDE